MARTKADSATSMALELRIAAARDGLLDLDGLGLSHLPTSVCSLQQITGLSVSGNRLVELPPWIGNFENLRFLFASQNQLKVLPAELQKLKNLEVLDLADNNLLMLPDWLLTLRRLEALAVDGNPALNLPIEIVGTSVPRKILDFYFRVAGGARSLNEFKLTLVGRGGAGKTSLVHRLIDDEYKEFKRTPGIKITKWPVTIDGDDVRAHVWDFGGQEIMHGTHRFFMTARALYVALISGREGTEDHDAEYWLSLIRSFAGDVPVIVLLHKWGDYPFELNRELLREKYGRDLAFLETDSKSGHGIETLRREICRQAQGLPGLKASWPAEWRQIKEELPARKKSWVTFDDFRAFCGQRGVAEPRDQEALADSLHALGLMLSYQNDETLRNFGVLNPQWVTKGIYQMLNAPSLRESGGKFDVGSFAEILPASQYPQKLHSYLLALMRKFQLCHPLDERGKRYLIPELLTKEEPLNLDQEFVPEKCLGFIYQYDSVLPEGLLPRFIVETYVHREPKLAWRTGVVLERANCRALVRGDVQGRTVVIRVSGVGNGRRELLGIIREHFERIHATYEKLPVTEQVPVPGHPSSVVRHELLLKYERSERDTIPVEIGDELKDFNVKELLDGIDLPGALRGATYRPTASLLARPVFISYSHKDAAYLDQLKAALVPYERMGELSLWSDRMIDAGQSWEDVIYMSLRGAALVIMLLSNDFLASDYAMDKELPRAVERHDAGDCIVVPIVIRPCRWEKLPLGKIQAILPGGRAVSQYDKPDDAWLEVTKQLDRVIARVG
jgi:internalin A